VIVVTGADGQLGTAMRRLVPDATFLGRADLDMADTGSIRPTLEALDPELLINCAAYTAVDRAEDEEDLATLVNADAVREMGWMCADHAVPFVTYSSDYVFGGTSQRPWVESDPLDPINAYGRSKALGERYALQTHPDALVIRTSWVISGTHRNFVTTMLRLAADREVAVVDDQHGCPTIADDLAGATLAAVQAGVTGVLHLANQGATTWFELARASVELAGIDPERIQPCATADYPSPARRPAYSVLGSERREELGLDALAHWRDSLPAVVDSLLKLP
jgi:dTDP-4-dehydrorhamnose reductase